MDNLGTSFLEDLKSQATSAGSDLLKSVTEPIQAKVNQQLDKVVQDIRNKIANKRKVALSKVTDLEISEYLLSMPLKSTNDVLDEQIADAGRSIRNGIIIGFIILTIGVFLSRKVNN